jgi:hypothetical protein
LLKTGLLLLLAAPLAPPSPAPAGATRPPPDAIVIYTNRPPLRPLPFSLPLGRTPPASLRQLVAMLEAAIPESHRARMAAYYSSPWDDLREGAYSDLYIPEIFAAAAKAWPRPGPELERRIGCVGRDFSSQVAMQIAFDHVRSHWRVGETIRLTDRAKGLMEASFISRRLFEVCDSLPARERHAVSPSRRSPPAAAGTRRAPPSRT